MDERFKVKVLSSTPNPQQLVWLAMHQDYCEGYVGDRVDKAPIEEKAGELIVKTLLQGNRGHFGCLEYPQITFATGYFPHSVMQQARTHRIGTTFDVQCLAGSVEITFKTAAGGIRKIPISELYDLWVNGEKAIRQRAKRGRNGELPGLYRRDCKTRLKKMKLRILNEDSQIFETGNIKEVFYQGKQHVYRLTLEDGRILDCTTEHRLLTDNGWTTMKAALNLVISQDHKVQSFSTHCCLMTNGVVVGDGIYQKKEWLEEQLALGLTAKQIAQKAQCSYECIKKWIYTHGLKLNVAPQIHRKFNYICQKCGQTGCILHAHHLLPVYSHPHLGYELDNLVTVCKKCHENIHSQNLELEFAQNFVQIDSLPDKPRPKPRKLKCHPLKVVQVKYLGLQDTYDLEVEGQWHNFVANGVVVHNSMRYTGQRLLDAFEHNLDIEDLFYLRPIGTYTNRQGKKYQYTAIDRERDLSYLEDALGHYSKQIYLGMAEEHARGTLPFDFRQHFVVGFNARSLMHFLDLRAKKDAQLEIQWLCELMFPHFQTWMPQVASWYEKNRYGKALLAP